jgi:hypothetical protein
MSGIQKTEINDAERKMIQEINAVRYGGADHRIHLTTEETILRCQMITPKILLAVVDLLQDLKLEIATLRHSNQQMEYKLNSIVSGKSVMVQNMN